MLNMNKTFSLLIKPSSADCNLKCRYCFYLDKCSIYPDTKVHRMSEYTLERLIASYMETNQAVYSFNWQGGEPTLMGIDFFRKVIELQKKYGKRGCQVANSVQTNGTLITDEFATLFKEYNFLLGVSLDGPEEIHNAYRLKQGGQGSHKDVLRGISILKKHNVDFNILTLVNDINVKRGVEVYKYLRDMGFNYHQYIPCVEFDESGEQMPYSVDPVEWGKFLCDIFDEWIKKDKYKVSIRLFDSILNFMANGYYNLCQMSGTCCQYYVVEHNGDIYPCDFFVEKEKKLGNIIDSSWRDIINSKVYAKFGAQKSNWDKECSSCKYLNFCSGDCLKHRMPYEKDKRNFSRLCEGWKLFYEHTLPRFEDLAREILKRRPVPNNRLSNKEPMLYPSFDIGRNDTCYCGSGKKFKKCHGQFSS